MLLFGMISRHIGDHEAGRVFLTEIASDLGISIDTASRELNRLEGSGVLGHKRTGRENEYFHTWHPMLVNGLLPVHLDLATLSLGERYNAYRRFLFILVPLALIKWRRISYGATLLFGLLCFHGRNGSCYVGDEKLAAELVHRLPESGAGGENFNERASSSTMPHAVGPIPFSRSSDSDRQFATAFQSRFAASPKSEDAR